jgi:hypothetical protein
VSYPTDYRPDNPLPRTPDNHRRAIGVTPRNMGRRFKSGQRKHGDLKAHTEQKEIQKRGAHTGLGRCPGDQSREDLT